MTDIDASASERPVLLDLFCGAGGAAMGYHGAGFDVVGVDINPQPNYPFEFHQADAIAAVHDLLNLTGPYACDAIHASPVCYAWSKMRNCRPGSKDDQPDLITPLRPLLIATGLPYVIENVPGSPLLNPVQICGSGLGMPLQRHRLFESNVPLWGVPCAHGQNPWNPAYRHSTGRKRRRVPVIGEWRVPKQLQDDAMGIDWMTLPELTEAIPPAYCRFIGEQLMRVLRPADEHRSDGSSPAPLEAMIACPACGSAVRDRCEHYVASVGHLTPPEDACDPYWRCTGESAAEVWARDGGRR